MKALLVEHYLGRLRQARRYARQAFALAALTGIGALAATQVDALLATALALGAVLEVGLGVLARLRRRELLMSLAVDPTAYVIPDVRRFGDRLVSPRQRTGTARLLRTQIATPRRGRRPLRQRVTEHRDELDRLARLLVARDVRVEPPAAALLVRLLTRPSESPLYNPRLPEADLGVALARVQAGIARGPFERPRDGRRGRLDALD
ncbi:MAG: hypothetical protein R3C15_22895 [Thermoleophilia bacterium]